MIEIKKKKNVNSNKQIEASEVKKKSVDGMALPVVVYAA